MPAAAARRRTARPGCSASHDPAFDDYLVAPKAEALAQIAAAVTPAAVLLTSRLEGKEVAGRLAVRLGSG